MPGLRREELAQLAGLSATWYTWIEQRRDVSISPRTLARLANVSRLSRPERAYLFELAEKRDPAQDEPAVDAVPPAVLACLETIAAPAYVLDRSWTARGWNAQAELLFVGWLDRAGGRNLLRFIFLEPAARSLIPRWEERARRVVAEFRAERSAHMDTPALRSLVAELRDQSMDFAQFWDQHAVLGRDGGERTFRHPEAGFLRYEQVTFTLASQPEMKLTMLLRQAA